MNTIIVIGMTGQGKSEFIKQYIGSNRNCLVFDVQNEYGSKPKYPGQRAINLSSDTTKKRSRYIFQDFNGFVEIVKQKKNTICVFEEATMFLSGRIGMNVKEIMINKMFTKNVYIFVFHSIVDCPPGIMRISNYVVLYKTADVEKAVKHKYEKLYPTFLELQKLPNGSNKIIKIV